MRLANSVINDFESEEHDPMIIPNDPMIVPSCLFNDFESKPIVFIDVPFCNENEKVSKQLLKKLNVFAKEKYGFRIA